MEPKRTGMLSVGGGHKLYWEDWGNPKAKVPIFHLHGGPGIGISETDRLLYDGKTQRVIFFDQRGSGRSTPQGGIENNTTSDLIADIDKLRRHLNIGVISLTGGSWGSSLALFYALANPEVVQKMVIWAIWLVRKEDHSFVYQGEGLGYHFMDVWQRFSEMVPDIERGDTVSYYNKQFSHRDSAVSNRYVKEWALFESSLSSLDPQVQRKALEAQIATTDDKAANIAKIEAHYIANDCFVNENYILDNTKAIRHIPTVLVHGRFDFLCPPKGAFDLHSAFGENSHLHMVSANHSRSAPALKEAVAAYCRTFLA